MMILQTGDLLSDTSFLGYEILTETDRRMAANIEDWNLRSSSFSAAGQIVQQLVDGPSLLDPPFLCLSMHISEHIYIVSVTFHIDLGEDFSQLIDNFRCSDQKLTGVHRILHDMSGWKRT
jgi:hypothetical protein